MGRRPRGSSFIVAGTTYQANESPDYPASPSGLLLRRLHELLPILFRERLDSVPERGPWQAGASLRSHPTVLWVLIPDPRRSM